MKIIYEFKKEIGIDDIVIDKERVLQAFKDGNIVSPYLYKNTERILNYVSNMPIELFSRMLEYAISNGMYTVNIEKIEPKDTRFIPDCITHKGVTYAKGISNWDTETDVLTFYYTDPNFDEEIKQKIKIPKFPTEKEIDFDIVKIAEKMVAYLYDVRDSEGENSKWFSKKENN